MQTSNSQSPASLTRRCSSAQWLSAVEYYGRTGSHSVPPLALASVVGNRIWSKKKELPDWALRKCGLNANEETESFCSVCSGHDTDRSLHQVADVTLQMSDK